VNQNKQLNAVNQSSDKTAGSLTPYMGPRWLVEERDACGVGFIASLGNQASHELVACALSALSCLEHRGGCSADGDSGDGAGLMTAIPWELFSQWFADCGQKMPHPDQIGVGMVFFPQEAEAAALARQIVEKVLTALELTLLGWRVVPVQPNVLGVQAREHQLQIKQMLVVSQKLRGDELERQLYIARRRIGKTLDLKSSLKWADNFYLCSFSNRTIVYKGMVRSAVLGDFYTDLRNPAYKSAFAIYHRRFSTNTLPKRPLTTQSTSSTLWADLSPRWATCWTSNRIANLSR